MTSMLSRRALFRLLPYAVVGTLFLGGLFFLWIGTLRIPDLASFEERRVTQSTKIYDRTGEILLYDLHEDVQRTVVPIGDMSRHIKNATVAIEDREFYEHQGIKPTAILRAFLSNFLILIGLSDGYTQGGSTITQQVVKNSVLTKDKTLTRKIKEWVLAFKLERVLTKEQILELYLNESPYGGNLYGIEEAARGFLGVSAASLTLPQAAYLAALPQAPTYYSPYGNHRDALEARKNLVLLKMKENDFITEEEYQGAKKTAVEFLPPRDRGIKAPHFVFYVRDSLAELYGEEALQERGFRVITTLDFNLQRAAEKTVEKYARENTEKFNATNAGLVALDPKTGQILTMVGSRDYFDEEIEGNFNVTLGLRQPGSAIKPFVYATALTKGYTADTVVFDVRTQFSTACAADNFTSEGECYSPVNYDGVFRGPVTFRSALAQSINVAAVKVLYLAGLKDALRLAKDMGLTTLTDPSRYGLTLVLGGGEVRLLDLVAGYGGFASEGIRRQPKAILRIEDAAGEVIEEFRDEGVRVVPEQTARILNNILSDNAARSPAFGENSSLYFPGRDVAAKTGTTNDYRDAWIVGYTPNLVAGAWAGNNDNAPMQKKVAGFIVAPLWHEFMETALASLPEESFTPPDSEDTSALPPILRGIWQGGEVYAVDKITGSLASNDTPPGAREEKVVAGVHSILNWIDKDNPRGGRPAAPGEDPQFRLWEPPVRAWAAAAGYVDQLPGTLPTTVDAIHTSASKPTLSLRSPSSALSYPRDGSLVIEPSVSGPFPVTKIDYYINGLFVGEATRPPFSLAVLLKGVQSLSPGVNTLRAVAQDSILNTTEATASFFVTL